MNHNSNISAKNIVWVITDARPGNNSQVYGIAKFLGESYKEINISYNKLVKLPNLFLGSSLKAIDRTSKKLIGEMLQDVIHKKTPAPNYVISAGRRSACVSSYMKKYLMEHLNERDNDSDNDRDHDGEKNYRVKNCHIMHPNLSFKLFDLVVLFTHDNNPHSNDENVIEVVSSPNIITDDVMAEYKDLWQEKFKEYDKPIIGVLMGGSTKSQEFSLQDVINLANKLNQEAERLKASVLITTSRRTPKEAISIFNKHISQPKYIYEWTPSNHEENPYKGILALSDYLVVTGDSISMCSEACGTQAKGVYIYSSSNISSQKHMRMHKNIFEKDLARDFMDNQLEYWERSMYNSSLEIANKLRGAG